MGLLNDLRALADRVDPSVLPQSNEVGKLLGALIYRVEHGEQALAELTEKDAQQVTDLFAGIDGAAEPVDPATVPTPGVPFTPPVAQAAAVEPANPAAPAFYQTESDLQAQIAALQDQLAAREATANQTVVDHQPGLPNATGEEV
jgi:hypothetical protein